MLCLQMTQTAEFSVSLPDRSIVVTTEDHALILTVLTQSSELKPVREVDLASSIGIQPIILRQEIGDIADILGPKRWLLVTEAVNHGSNGFDYYLKPMPTEEGISPLIPVLRSDEIIQTVDGRVIRASTLALDPLTISLIHPLREVLGSSSKKVMSRVAYTRALWLISDFNQTEDAEDSIRAMVVKNGRHTKYLILGADMEKTLALFSEQRTRLISDGNSSLDINGVCSVYYDRIFSYFNRHINSPDDAQDLTQQTFVLMIQALKRDKYSEEGKLTPWLWRIAHNVRVSYYRDQAIKGKYFDMSGQEPHHKIEDQVLSLLEVQERVDELTAVLPMLPSSWQQILYLRFIKGLNVKEVAAGLGKSEGAVKVATAKAIQRLRELIH